MKQPELRKALNGGAEDMCSIIREAVKLVVEQAEDGEQGQLKGEGARGISREPGAKSGERRAAGEEGGFKMPGALSPPTTLSGAASVPGATSSCRSRNGGGYEA